MSEGIRPSHHRLQSFQPLVPTTAVKAHTGSSGASGRLDTGHGDRHHLYQGTPLGAWWKRGGKSAAIGSSRGGQTTKIHVITDLLGRPAITRITAGNVSDVHVAGDLVAAAGPLKCLIADKGYDADALRNKLRADGARPVIPGRINRKRVAPRAARMASSCCRRSVRAINMCARFAQPMTSTRAADTSNSARV